MQRDNMKPVVSWLKAFNYLRFTDTLTFIKNIVKNVRPVLSVCLLPNYKILIT